MELSSLNLTFGSNLGLTDSNNISYEKTCLYNCSRFLTNLKRILQFNLNKKVDCHIFSNFEEYVSIYYINVINNLLLIGHVSLSKNYISNLFVWIKKNLNQENLNYLLHILYEISEYDFKFVLDILLELIQIDLFLSILKHSSQYSSLLNLICLKYFVYSGNSNLVEFVSNKLDESSFNSFHCYFSLNISLLKLKGKVSKVLQNEFVDELYCFKSICKKLDFNKFTLEIYLMISQVLIKQERYTEALIYVNKAKIKSKLLNLNTIHTKSKYFQSKLLFLRKDYEKSMKIIRKIHSNIDKNADVKIKAEFYLLQANLYLIQNKKDISPHITQILRFLLQSLEFYCNFSCQTGINECLGLLHVITKMMAKIDKESYLQSRYIKVREFKELTESRIKILNTYLNTYETSPEKRLITLRLILDETDKFIENLRKIFNFQ